MSILIRPTILSDTQNTDKIPSKENFIYRNCLPIRQTIYAFPLTNAFERIRIHPDIYVVSSAIQKIDSLSSEAVQKQVIKLLSYIQNSLNKIYAAIGVSRRFPQLLLNEQSDLSALVEWNFEKFRVGFSLEQNPEDSAFYFLAINSSNGIINSITNDLGSDPEYIVQAIINYCFWNT